MFPNEDRDYQQVLGDKAYMMGVSPYFYVGKYTHLLDILILARNLSKNHF